MNEIAKKLAASKDEKYSPNLRLYLRKWLSKLGDSVELVVVRSNDDVHFIGYFHDGDFIGVILNSVFGCGTKAESGCWMGSRNWKQIKSWWLSYQRLGVCFTDCRHSWYSQRWVKLSTHRRGCRFCGLEQKHKTITRTVRDEIWISVKPKAKKGVAA